MTSDQPLVSIVIPVYNGANYIAQAIQSALEQTYHNCEIIVVNDGSNDNTEAIAKSYGKKIRYFAKKNGGVATALNLAIKEMKGSFFSWLSHDDMFYPDKIQRQIDYLKGLGRDAALYSDYDFVDGDGVYLHSRKLPSAEPEQLKYILMTRHQVHGCTTLIPKYFFDHAGLFDENLQTVQDYEMWYRISKQFEFIHMNAVLIKSRLHADQGSNKRIKLNTRECNEFYTGCFTEIAQDDGDFSSEKECFIFFLKAAYHAARCKTLEAAQCALNFARRYNKHRFSIFYWLVLLFYRYKNYQYANL